jgi:hypothetical protein
MCCDEWKVEVADRRLKKVASDGWKTVDSRELATTYMKH